MSTLLNRAPPPPQREKQAPRTLGKVRDGDLLGVWNWPMECGILEAWVALLQESPTGSHLHGDTAWFVKHSRAFRDGKKKKKKKKYTHTHTQNRAFLLGQGSGIGILSFDSHPWKRLTPSSDRGCICCCLKPKGETSNSPCCYGLPGAHCPLPRRCLLTQPLPASHFKALAHHLWSSFISSAWLLRKPAQENVVTGLRLKKKKAEVGLCSQSFNSQTRATISSLQLTVLWESSEVAFSLSGS